MNHFLVLGGFVYRNPYRYETDKAIAKSTIAGRRNQWQPKKRNVIFAEVPAARAGAPKGSSLLKRKFTAKPKK